MRSSSSRNAGFTLLELMIVVAIIAILAAIALPSYGDYVKRGYLVDGTNVLASYRAQMEQYYQDARSYADVGTSFKSPCDALSGTTNWSFSCNGTQSSTSYVITATGAGPVNGFVYTIDQSNTQNTTSGSWGTSTGATGHWIMKKGG